MITNMDGSVYSGGWKDGERHGQGTITYFSGRTYSGKWENGAWKGGCGPSDLSFSHYLEHEKLDVRVVCSLLRTDHLRGLCFPRTRHATDWYELQTQVLWPTVPDDTCRLAEKTPILKLVL